MSPPGDMGQVGAVTILEASLTLGGTTSAGGPSPLAIDYTIDLTAVSENGRIIRAVPVYTAIGGAPSSLSDDGGISNTQGEWTEPGVARLNAAGRDAAFAVHADWSFTSPPPSGQLGVISFTVRWIEPVSG